jgi:H+/Cl- antiporter ClcA
MPIGIVITLWVLLKKVKADSLKYYIFLGVVWALIAIVFDYFFLVKVFNPADGYYKLDVYLYYIVTFILPVIVGLKNKAKNIANIA